MGEIVHTYVCGQTPNILTPGAQTPKKDELEVGELGTLGVFCRFQAIPNRLVEVIGAESAAEAEISRVYRPVLGVV